MKTRAQMEEIVARKESVVYNGRVISEAKDLPSEEDLAAGDAEAQARIADSIEEQIRRLEARRDRLTAGNPPAPAVPAIAPAPAAPPTPTAPPPHPPAKKAEPTGKSG
jgi:hypothetical protein